jgi:adenylate cyclase
MADAVLAHHGMVDKYLGDAVMAVFGAPFPQPDQASHAFCAALEMQARQVELSARWAARLGREIDIGIGIHTGPVALGNVGHDRHREYAVVGDTVNVASRLKDLAQPGEILASEAAVHAAGAALTVEPSVTRTIRGRSAPVAVYVVRAAV